MEPQKRYPNSRTCIKCNIVFKLDKYCRVNYCNECKISLYNNKNTTLGEIKNSKSLKNKHPSWVTVHCRLLNRKWNNELPKLPCKICGYSLHVELCHIKAVSSFPDTATLGEINDKSNVINLCKNCHRQLDRKLITIGDKQ